MRSKLSSRTILVNLSKQHINEAISRYLYQFGYTWKNEEISGLQYEWSDNNVIPIEMTIAKLPREVTVIKHNG